MSSRLSIPIFAALLVGIVPGCKSSQSANNGTGGNGSGSGGSSGTSTGGIGAGGVGGTLLGNGGFDTRQGDAEITSSGGSGSGGALLMRDAGFGGTTVAIDSAGSTVETGDSSAGAYACPLTDLYCDAPYIIDSHGCVVCTPRSSDAGSTGGSTGTDDAKVPVLLGPADQAQAGQCTSTGGHITIGWCCNSIRGFPDACFHSHSETCSCSTNDSHYIADCSCPTGKCFYPSMGCATP
jgi:hypothetical protein